MTIPPGLGTRVPSEPGPNGCSPSREKCRSVITAVVQRAGVVVSTALMKAGAGEHDLVHWDADLCRRFMDAAMDAARAA